MRCDHDLLTPVAAGTAVAEATADQAWLQALLDAEAGLARAESRLGMLPAESAMAVTAAAHASHYDVAELAVAARGAGNPVVPLVGELRAAVSSTEGSGTAAEHVHQGATSQDIMDTAAMLVSHRAREMILAELDRVCAALAALAARHRETPTAGRTLGMQAVPTTFGLTAAGWLTATAAARDRLADVALPAQLGGAAGTLAAFGERPEPAVRLLGVFAAELGLAEPVLPWHTDRGPVAGLGAALALVAGALGKIGTDVVGLAATEVAEVAEPTAVGRGASSAMPHKRNPVLATMIRSAALRVPAQAQVLMACQLAAHQRPAGEWHAEWRPLCECLRLTGGAAETAAELVEGLEVFGDRMRANMRDELVSERLLGVLAEPLGGRAEAANLLAEASRTAARTGGTVRDALAARDDVDLDPSTLAELLDPAGAVGAAPALVDRALEAYRARST